MRHKEQGRASTRSPLWKVPITEEVRRELEFHLEMRTEEYMSEGLNEQAARKKALERFGDPSRHAAECRGLASRRDLRFRLMEALSELRLDGAFALRQARAKPGLSLCVVAILSLGIGATVALFSLVNGVLLQPLPFPEPDRLVAVWEEQFVRASGKNVVAPANFLDWRDQNTSFERLAGFATTAANLTGDGNPQRAAGRLVTDGYFEVLGRAPLMGRYLQPEDSVDGSAPVVVLSHHLWQQRFAGRPDILGQSLEIDSRSSQIVGVMPEDFALDMGPLFAPLTDAADFWWPLPITEAWRQPRGRWLIVIARLTPGASLKAAQTEMSTVSERLREEFPGFNTDWGTIVEPLHAHVTQAARPPLIALFGAMVLVLLIVCVNVASLLVARATGRSQEVAIRTALGAGRSRIVRQLLLEGALLSTVAAAFGFLLATFLVGSADRFLPDRLLSDGILRIDTPMLALVVAIVVVCSLFFGLLPGWYASRRPYEALRSGSAGGPGRHRLRSGLVFAEIALAVVLLFGAGLMLRTVRGLLRVDPGFDPRNVTTFRLNLPRNTEARAISTFYDRLLTRLDALPGVRATGATTSIPMGGSGAGTSFYPTDRPQPENGQAPVANIRVVRGDYFRALAIPLLQGRTFDARDQSDSRPGSILINEALAQRYWPSSSPLGRELAVSWGDEDEPPREIVGVVRDVHQRSLDVEVRDAIYFPHEQEIDGSLSIVVHAERDSDTLIAEATAVVRELDPKLPVFDVETLSAVVDRSLSERRFLARTLSLFAILALLLAALGIYGVTHLSVVQRTREMGLRIALGASPAGISRLILRQTAGLTLLALAAGSLIALGASRAVGSLVYGVRTTDPATLITAAIVLLMSAWLAAWLPSRRASRTAPTQALREP